MSKIPVQAAGLLALLAMTAPIPALASGGCVLTFALEAAEPLESLQFLVDYSAVEGSFAGSGTEAGCASLIESATIVASDICDGSTGECSAGPARALTVVMIHPDGLPTQSAVAQCRFESSTAIDTGALSVELIDAALPGALRPPSARPKVSISAIDCPGTLPDSTAFGPATRAALAERIDGWSAD